RVAIGWHFLFEGLHKLHSRAVGPTETNKPFSSEMFHATAEGPAGPLVRRYFLDDTEKLVAEKKHPNRPVEAAEFAKLKQDEQAQLCPTGVATELEKACQDSKLRLEEELIKAKADRDEVHKTVDPVKPRQEADAAKV